MRTPQKHPIPTLHPPPHIQTNLNGTKTTQGQNWHTPIPNHTYTVNQQNWHDTNSTTNPDLPTARNSITAGYALNHQHTWPHILANHTNQTLNNIGWPGASIAQTIQIIHNHTHHWGTPKHTHIRLPDITQSWATHNNHNQPNWYNPTTRNHHTHQKTAHKFKQHPPDQTKKHHPHHHPQRKHPHPHNPQNPQTPTNHPKTHHTQPTPRQ